MEKPTRWDEEADVVVVGYGGAGAATAIAAHDAGAKVLILEKQPSDTPTRTRHTPSTRISGGSWFAPPILEKAVLYLEGLTRIANERLTPERREMLSVFAKHLVDNTEWMLKIGIEIGGEESRVHSATPSKTPTTGADGKTRLIPEFPELPGSDCSVVLFPRITGKYRSGAALFKYLSDAVQKRGIRVMWESPGEHLIAVDGEVRGVVAKHNGREIRIRANRGVVLTCGGFEFNEYMKENYLRVNPVHFTGSPACTGDGINMATEVGAAMWHMSSAAWRVAMKFTDFPVALGTQCEDTGSILVDKRGKRFTNERFRRHSFAYELTNYDCRALCYPRVPCYWIFGERRRRLAPLASLNGFTNPPGGVMGDTFYNWSADNQQEIDRGWVMKAGTVEELGKKIMADTDNGGLMTASALENTIRQYEDYCRKGEDPDFHKEPEWLQPLDGPPYYAVKLWPGGPNTQGGPKRNVKGQIVRVDNTPVPRLYSAGELGSVWGMFYQGAGNIAECIAFGRISGANAAAEKAW